MPGYANFFIDLNAAANLLEPLGYRIFFDLGVEIMMIKPYRPLPVWSQIPHTDMLARMSCLGAVEVADRRRNDLCAVVLEMAMSSGGYQPELQYRACPGRLYMTVIRQKMRGPYRYYSHLMLHAAGYGCDIRFEQGKARVMGGPDFLSGSIF